jgi:two-component system nitrogen regulation response regulator GlnG
MPKILAVDDQTDMLWVLARLLSEQGFAVLTAADGQEAVQLVKQERPHVVILDLKMPGVNGMQALEQIKEIAPEVAVIVLTAYGDIPSAVQAMRLGAYDYLTKPFDNADLLYTVKRALERQELLSQMVDLRTQLKTGGPLQEVMGSSPPIQEVFQQIQQVARSNFTVVIEGETGTGKELVARAIHQYSNRSAEPFIALDCGAIPETLIESELFGYEPGAFTGADRRKVGHFQLAEKGTLFLDEVTNLPLATQSKLLRTLQERQLRPLGGTRVMPVDLRLIASSNVSLESEVQAGRFRLDLFHRLNEFTIHIPPLRERQPDIVHLAKRFLSETNLELKKNVREFSEEAVASLLSYPWPGNVRELRNVVRRATLLSRDLIRPEHLSGIGAKDTAVPDFSFGELYLQKGLALKEIAALVIARVEREVIQRALSLTQGNKSQAARLLQIDYKTLYSKIKAHGIQAKEFLP